MLSESSTLKRSSFASLADFINRANYLREEIEKGCITIDDTQALYYLLNGLREAYSDNIQLWEYRIDKGELKWGDFMQILFVKAQIEKHLNLAYVPKKPNDDKISNKKGKSNKPGEKETCSTCNKEIGKGYKHHECGNHIPLNGITCFWCNPESAPTSWRRREEALKKKTTTAATFRQGGNNLTQPPADTEPSSLLFVYNGLNYVGNADHIEEDFSWSPRRY
ncbi:hypothetical protein B0T26DRAFT_745284 [Lasiosphaeria miniovina]|uniref:Uncharacterized protein n=1 Tax=Lasiosphaeria miniovina TaxID=1954250 RepID=A0AA40BFB7_9PEZI|nr:uncharacterized protein B0T26DRAFT_745284 [Lasiosphaeria miniovina]KAK0733216.1 hypothetical protein B0T26DRAFT_745284 [Lasiosphaeria miniovina]